MDSLSNRAGGWMAGLAPAPVEQASPPKQTAGNRKWNVFRRLDPKLSENMCFAESNSRVWYTNLLRVTTVARKGKLQIQVEYWLARVLLFGFRHVAAFDLDAPGFGPGTFRSVVSEAPEDCRAQFAAGLSREFRSGTTAADDRVL